MKYMEFVTHNNLGSALGRHVSAYRERVVNGRHFPEPAYGTLEMIDGRFVVFNKKTYTKLEEGEGVFII